MDSDPASEKQSAPKRTRRTKSHRSVTVNSSSEFSSLSSTPSEIPDADLTMASLAQGPVNEPFETINEKHLRQRYGSPHESGESVIPMPMEAYKYFTIGQLISLCEENNFDDVAGAIRYVMNLIWTDQANLVQDPENTVDVQGLLAYGEATVHLHGNAFLSLLGTDPGNIVGTQGINGEGYGTSFVEDSLEGPEYSLVQGNMTSQDFIESMYGGGLD